MTNRQRYKEIYWCWKAIKQRCLNPKCSAYHNYGARGITVCDEWKTFEPFLEWCLSNGWKKGLDIDRIDNDKGYSPDNCRYVTRKQGTNNRRMTIYISVNGCTKPLTEWADETDIPATTVLAWVHKHGKEYAAFRIKDALDNGYIKRNYSYSHTKRVLYLDENKIFNSVKEASEYVGCNPANLSTALNHNSGITKLHGRFQFL